MANATDKVHVTSTDDNWYVEGFPIAANRNERTTKGEFLKSERDKIVYGVLTNPGPGDDWQFRPNSKGFDIAGILVASTTIFLPWDPLVNVTAQGGYNANVDFNLGKYGLHVEAQGSLTGVNLSFYGTRIYSKVTLDDPDLSSHTLAHNLGVSNVTVASDGAITVTHMELGNNVSMPHITMAPGGANRRLVTDVNASSSTAFTFYLTDYSGTIITRANIDDGAAFWVERGTSGIIDPATVDDINYFTSGTTMDVTITGNHHAIS